MATEQRRLKPSTIASISRRSGKSKQELQLLLDAADLRGKRVTVRYEVVRNR